jgi:quinol-cytochrome oxidoreductase complex cytochrome b subunit
VDSQRTVILTIALVFIVGFAALTVSVAIEDGVTALVLVSLVILALFGFGVVGALRNPPDE